MIRLIVVLFVVALIFWYVRYGATTGKHEVIGIWRQIWVSLVAASLIIAAFMFFITFLGGVHYG
jgi:hypothetical protein